MDNSNNNNNNNNSSGCNNESYILIDGIAISTSFGKKKKITNHDASQMFAGSNSFLFNAPTSPTLNNSCENNDNNNNNSTSSKEQKPAINQHSKQQKNKFKRNKKKDKLKRKKNFQNNLPPKKSNTTSNSSNNSNNNNNNNNTLPSIQSSHNAEPIDNSIFYDYDDQDSDSEISDLDNNNLCITIAPKGKGKNKKKGQNKDDELLLDYISHMQVSDEEDKNETVTTVIACNFTFEDKFDNYKLSKNPKNNNNNKKKKKGNNNNNNNNNNSNNNVQQQQQKQEYSEDEEEVDLDMGSYKKKCRLQRIQSRNQQRKKRSIDSKYSKKIAFVKGNILNDQEPLDETNTFSPPLLPKRVSFQLPKESDVIILSSGNEDISPKSSSTSTPITTTTTTINNNNNNRSSSKQSTSTSTSISPLSSFSLNSSTSTLEHSNVSSSEHSDINDDDDDDDDDDIEIYDAIYDYDDSDESDSEEDEDEDYSYQFQSEEDFEDEMDTDSDIKETFKIAIKNIFPDNSDIEGYDSLSESDKSSSSTTNTSGRVDDDDDDDDDDNDKSSTIRGCYINSEPSGDEFFTNPFKPKIVEKPKEVIEISDDCICIDDDGSCSDSDDLTDQETVRKSSFFDWISKVHGPKIVIPDKNPKTGKVQELIDVDQFDSLVLAPQLIPNSIVHQPYQPSKPTLYPFINECIESSALLKKDILDLYEKGASISSYSIKELTSIATLFDNIILHRYTNEFPLWPMSKLSTHQVEFLAQQYNIYSETRKIKDKKTIFILVYSSIKKPSNKKKDSFILAAFTESGEYSVHDTLFSDNYGKKLLYSNKSISKANNKSSPKNNKNNTRRGGGKKKHQLNNNQQKKNKHQQQNMDPKINTVKHGDVVAQDVAPISHTNVGNILLKRMGWQGGGLGAIGQGLDEPIQAIVRKERFGLGFS